MVMALMKQDYIILRELGKKVAEIANLPVQKEKKELWTANNGLNPVRPMVYIDQLPWNEINTSSEMQLVCGDPFHRLIEQRLRETVYRWNHFPCDMVVENRIDIPHQIEGLCYGMHIKEHIAKTDETNGIVSHEYIDQVATEEELAALKYDSIQVDRELDRVHLDLCNDIFKDVLPVRFEGVQIHLGVWDRIAQMRSVEKILWDIVDHPEFTEKIVRKFMEITMSTIDQCESLGLLDEQLQYVHCTGAYTNDLPKDGMEDGKPKSRNVWAFGMSQIFSTVSPETHEMYDIDLLLPMYERFGLIYYGCCEPLERKINIIRKIKNVRKISVSPWANIDMCADGIGSDYVFSCKCNPAFIATGIPDEQAIYAQLNAAIEACRRNNTPLEIILKDVSTVGYKLDLIDKWNTIAMNLVMK
jgi:hypothetical protein